MEMVTVEEGKKKMLIFPTGRIYKCSGDLIKECQPKIEIAIEPKTFKVYKFAYVHFEYARYSLAKLVATAFLDNPKNYKGIRRKNGDPTDNSVGNLEWVADRRSFLKVTRQQMLAVDYDSLGACNKAAYRFVVHGDETGLFQLVTRPPDNVTGLIYTHSIYRYLYEALARRGFSGTERELRMEEGYELFKRRLLAYYLPVPGMLGEGRFRKYCYFCYVYNALDHRGERFVPRELSRNVASDEVSDYF